MARNVADSRSEDSYEQLAPLTFDPKIPACDAWDLLEATLKQRKRLSIESKNDTELRAVEKTPILRFKDDLHFELELDKIHMRSASRIGSYDLGANKHRLEEIRKAWQKKIDQLHVPDL